MRKYNPKTDIPRTGWDAMMIRDFLEMGATLYVTERGEVWTDNRLEYVGKVIIQHKNDSAE